MGLSDADLDEGERFDALEREKLLATNPDSVAYYQVGFRPPLFPRASRADRMRAQTHAARAPPRAPCFARRAEHVTTRIPSAVPAQAITFTTHGTDARYARAPYSTQRNERNGTGRVVSQAQKNHMHNINTRKVGAPKAPAKKAR